MTRHFQAARRIIRQMSEREELEDLQALIGERLDELAADEERERVEQQQSAGTKQEQRGYVELKYIPEGNKLHGPYAYLRWWDGKVHRSKYLGKAKEKRGRKT